MGKKQSDITITLAEPIKHGSDTITEITVRKPKGKHFKKVPVEPKTVGDLWPFACAICDQPSSVLDELGAEDFGEMMEAVGNFMPDGLQTGEK